MEEEEAADYTYKVITQLLELSKEIEGIGTKLQAIAFKIKQKLSIAEVLAWKSG